MKLGDGNLRDLTPFQCSNVFLFQCVLRHDKEKKTPLAKKNIA